MSCSYDFTKYNDEGGEENGIPYDIEFLDGEFAHLAIVDNPRYERANIVFNSKVDVNNDKWVTIKPNGKEHKGRHLLIKDGENVYDAMRRQWGVDVQGQQHLFDRNKYKTDKSYKDELYGKLQEHLKTVQKRYDNLEYLGVANPDELEDGDYEDISFEEWEEKQKDKEDKKETYYEDDMEESYTDSYADSISKDFDEFMKSKKEEKNEETPKSDLDTKREAYEATVKKMNDASKRKWNPKDNDDWYAAVKEESEAKKALTGLRRDYAESIMSNFEEVEDNPYEDKQEARRERYQELSEKAGKESSRYAQESRDMMSTIPMGQPILVGHHSEGRDRRYRQRAWDKMGKSYELSKKSDYYENKAASVGKGGISADDKNAIKKLADKYNAIKTNHQKMLDANKIVKSKGNDEEKIKKLVDAGWTEEHAKKILAPDFAGRVGFPDYQLTGNTAEMRRIIDRVIDIHSRSLKAVGSSADTNTDYSDYGFEVERNTDINRLQLKFPGKPDANVRDILKSNGFRWSPKEGAWQRQLTGNAEYSLKRVMEKLKANNSKEQDMALIEELKKLITKVENDKGDKDMVNNEKEDKRKLIDEVGGILKGKVDDEIIRTIIKKMEEASYNESEAGSADNKKVKNEADDEDEKVENKKVKNEETEEDKEKVEELKEDEKKDVENKCNNSKETFFDKMNKIYNSSVAQPKNDSYVSRADRLKAGEDYFKV